MRLKRCLSFLAPLTLSLLSLAGCSTEPGDPNGWQRVPDAHIYSFELVQTRPGTAHVTVVRDPARFGALGGACGIDLTLTDAASTGSTQDDIGTFNSNQGLDLYLDPGDYRFVVSSGVPCSDIQSNSLLFSVKAGDTQRYRIMMVLPNGVNIIPVESAPSKP
ncbi:MAG TPA: hypothetical protein VGS99_04085 [Gammaproteobacteria bacterium]|nr:hypothetical protein [Gammaproteobacteria bacterium]